MNSSKSGTVKAVSPERCGPGPSSAIARRLTGLAIASLASSTEKGTDVGEVEESFGVGLGPVQSAADLGQSCADHDDGLLLLGSTMEGRDQRGELLLFHVLKFVDVHRQGRIRAPGGRADSLEEGQQSCSRSPLSARPASGCRSKPTSMSPNPTLTACAKPERARRPRCARSLAFSILERRRSESLSWGANMPGSDLSSRGLDAEGVDAGGLGVFFHPIQEHGLAGAPKAGQYDAFRRQASPDALEGYAHGVQCVRAAGEFGRPGAGSGSEGVPDRVHDTTSGISDLGNSR
jgi:hypothetical protein